MVCDVVICVGAEVCSDLRWYEAEGCCGVYWSRVVMCDVVKPRSEMWCSEVWCSEAEMCHVLD